MKGSFVSRNGHYYAVLEETDELTGKRRRKWRTLHGNHKEAIKEFTDIVNAKNKGTYVEPSKTTVKDYLESWLKDVALPNMTPRNYAGYEFNIVKHIIPALGQLEITELKPQNIQKLIASQQTKGHFRTAQYIYSTLNKSLKSAVKMRVLAHSPCEGVEYPKVPTHEFKTMNEGDLLHFLEYARNTPYYSLFYTDLFTGLRRSELLALQWKDVDTNPLSMQISVNRTLHRIGYGHYKGKIFFKQPKTAKSKRLVTLTPSNAIVLREHYKAQTKLREEIETPEQKKLREKLGQQIIKDDDLVFSDPNGKPYQPDSITHAWTKLIKQSGLKGIRFHDARHTHATLMLKNGVHPKIVQERLGHSRISTTLDTYSHVAPGLQAAAANKFDDIITGKVEDTNSIIRR